MSSEPDWNLHRTFLAVLQQGSLSGAARQLGLTQPTVARHIDSLEHAVGGDLFLRTPRGLSPTEIAIELKPYAESLAATAGAMMRAASGATGDVRGTVRLTASEAVGVEHLPAILTQLRQRHPGLVLELAVSNAVDDLLGRESDIAVRNVEPTQGALVARKLPTIALGLHAHRAYLERRGTPRTVADLAAHDLIGFDRETPAIRGIAQRFPSLARSAFALRSDSDLAQLAAIRAGFGVGFCQVPIARRDPNLVRILPSAVNFEMGVWIVMHEDLKSSARCRVVFDALVEGLSNLNPAARPASKKQKP
jgi:DNA-binding transcriptional LysR family regulator